jgi:hypothetical protein
MLNSTANCSLTESRTWQPGFLAPLVPRSAFVFAWLTLFLASTGSQLPLLCEHSFV